MESKHFLVRFTPVIYVVLVSSQIQKLLEMGIWGNFLNSFHCLLYFQ